MAVQVVGETISKEDSSGILLAVETPIGLTAGEESLELV